MESKTAAVLAVIIVLALVWLFVFSPLAQSDTFIFKILTFISKILCALGAAWLSAAVTMLTNKKVL